MRSANLPVGGKQADDKAQVEMDAVADEISANLQALIGTTDESKPMADPKHPTTDSTTGKFANLQFGRNYDPNKR